MKTTDLSQVTDKRYHIKLYTSPWSRFELTTSVETDRHDITEILLKVALNTIKQTNKHGRSEETHLRVTLCHEYIMI
jgi:hypothetical protein